MTWEEACNILEVPYNSSKDEIKKAYRKQAKIYHPDSVHNRGKTKEAKKESEEKMKNVNKAYNEVLLDPAKRSAYEEEIARRERERRAQEQNAAREVQRKLANAKTFKINVIKSVDVNLNSNDYTAESWYNFWFAKKNAIEQVNAASTLEAVNAVVVPTTAGLVKKSVEQKKREAEQRAKAAEARQAKQEQIEQKRAWEEYQAKRKWRRKLRLIYFLALITASIPLLVMIIIGGVVGESTETNAFAKWLLWIIPLSFWLTRVIYRRYMETERWIPLVSFLLSLLLVVLVFAFLVIVYR